MLSVLLIREDNGSNDFSSRTTVIEFSYTVRPKPDVPALEKINVGDLGPPELSSNSNNVPSVVAPF
jgi:hypothetical protein